MRSSHLFLIRRLKTQRNALDTSSSSVTARVLPGPPVFEPLGRSAQIELEYLVAVASG